MVPFLIFVVVVLLAVIVIGRRHELHLENQVRSLQTDVDFGRIMFDIEHEHVQRMARLSIDDVVRHTGELAGLRRQLDVERVEHGKTVISLESTEAVLREQITANEQLVAMYAELQRMHAFLWERATKLWLDMEEENESLLAYANDIIESTYDENIEYAHEPAETGVMTETIRQKLDGYPIIGGVDTTPPTHTVGL